MTPPVSLLAGLACYLAPLAKPLKHLRSIIDPSKGSRTIRASFLLFTISCVVTSRAWAYQSMQVHCVDTAGEEVWILAYHQGADGDGGNRHQLYRERWTDDYFFQLNYQLSGLASEEGLPYSWTSFQLDLNDMTFTYRTLWNREVESEQQGSCAGITIEQI